VIKMSASKQCNLELETYWGCHHALTYKISTGYFQKADVSVVQYSPLFVCLFNWVLPHTDTDVPALLLEEDLRSPSVHYFRHKRATEWNRRSVS
jgi:hypothetical protein